MLAARNVICSSRARSTTDRVVEATSIREVDPPRPQTFHRADGLAPDRDRPSQRAVLALRTDIYFIMCHRLHSPPNLIIHSCVVSASNDVTGYRRQRVHVLAVRAVYRGTEVEKAGLRLLAVSDRVSDRIRGGGPVHHDDQLVDGQRPRGILYRQACVHACGTRTPDCDLRNRVAVAGPRTRDSRDAR